MFNTISKGLPMNLTKSLLGVTALSFALASTHVHANGPSEAGRNQLANKVTTALLLAGLGAKAYELFVLSPGNPKQMVPQQNISDHLPRKLTLLLTLILGAGKVGELVRPGTNRLALIAMLNSVLTAGMLANAHQFAKMPGMGYFARPAFEYDPSPHHLRTLSLICWLGVSTYGISWLVDKLGLTTVAEQAKRKGRR